MLRRGALVRTDILEECSACHQGDKQGTTLAVTSNRRPLHNMPKDGILQHTCKLPLISTGLCMGCVPAPLPTHSDLSVRLTRRCAVWESIDVAGVPISSCQVRHAMQTLSRRPLMKSSGTGRRFKTCERAARGRTSNKGGGEGRK
jgi:hypothetical protein